MPLLLITSTACIPKQTTKANKNDSELISVTEPLRSAEMIKKPYLLYSGNNTEMTILWQLDKTFACAIRWGLNKNYSSGSVTTNEYSTGENGHQHKHKISNLRSGTKYYYKIIVGNNEHAGSFFTAPSMNEKSVKFLAYGDTRTNTSDHNLVAQSIVSTIENDPGYQTFLIHTGDWVGNGDSESAWNMEYFSLPGVADMLSNLPVTGCIGNHEASGNLYDKYWPYPYTQNGRNWSFDYGPAHVTFIEHVYETIMLSETQLEWIEQDLSSTNKPWKFVVFHSPGYSAGGHANSPSVQNDLQPLLEQYGVSVVFNGHNHFYSRADVNGVMHVTVGGGGAPLYSPANSLPSFIVTAIQALHYCKIDIQGSEVFFQAVKPDGTVIDQFSIYNE